MEIKYPTPFWLALFTAVLALSVVALGAYTRLTDAGLGCPDWPGCYGQLTVPQTPQAHRKATQAFPHKPVVTHKAWAEMTHRYVAGLLATLVLVIAGLSLIRRKNPEQPYLLPLVLLGLVVFQALLGMWTVTMQLLPTVVMGHLLGGMSLFVLLSLLTLRLGGYFKNEYKTSVQHFRAWASLGLIILIAQIALGAWTSTNYAALICPTFPACNGTLFPTLDFKHAFNLLPALGLNYEGGILSAQARVTIQMIHRYGATITAVYLGFLSLGLIRQKNNRKLKWFGAGIFLLLIAQITLGISNVTFLLPLAVAIAHNLTATLLLTLVVTLNYYLYAKPDNDLL